MYTGSSGAANSRCGSSPSTLDKWNGTHVRGHLAEFGDDWVRLRALKGFVDGIEETPPRGSMNRSYSGKREWRDSTNTGATDGPGSGMQPAGNMERLLAGLDSAGWWANVHAIGAGHRHGAHDHGAGDDQRPQGRRWRIITPGVIKTPTSRSYKRLGIIAECSRITRLTTCAGWRSASGREPCGRTRSRLPAVRVRLAGDQRQLVHGEPDDSVRRDCDRRSTGSRREGGSRQRLDTRPAWAMINAWAEERGKTRDRWPWETGGSGGDRSGSVQDSSRADQDARCC